MPRTRTLRAGLTLAAASLGLLALTGCGGRANVKGALVLPQSVQLRTNDSVQVAFYPAEPNGVGAGLATYALGDKSFVAKAPDGKGLPPGKYKISVQVAPYPGSADSQWRAEQLADLNKAYAPASTNLTYDVTDAANQSITVDLTRGTVAAAKK